jgi:hypothetical protein
MTGAAHNPVIQRNSLYDKKVLEADLQRPDAYRQSSKEEVHANGLSLHASRQFL